MTEADLNKERTLAYTAGYNAAKAEQAVGLTESEREDIRMCQDVLRYHGYEVHREDLDALLARDAAAKAAGLMAVRREVLESLTLQAKEGVVSGYHYGNCVGQLVTSEVASASNWAIAEAEAALAAKGGE
jgi:hypothetical protein